MKRIISYVLCLSMLVSMLPVHVFAAGVDETTPVTEAALETEAPAVTEAPVADTTAAEEPEDTGSAAETTAPTEAPEVTETATEEATEAVTEDVTEPVQTETEETVGEETIVEFTWVPDVELPSDEELFAGYVDKVLYGTSTYGIMAGSRLTGDTKVAYDGFRALIEQVAAGELDSAEMTVGGVFSGSTIPDNLLNDLFYALLADLPYELYWFDKTKGVSGSYGTSGGELFITLYFTVSPHYSADGSEGTYDVDTAKTGAAAAAAANAQDIVDAYAESSDYEKLVAYRDEICKLAAYNDPAASSSYSGGYGDPWQLIWVFDGDTSTKVVCEGYSKAFQYLCDLSDFDADITCYSVQGDMDGGGHMWNIVSINGSSYLVDVTNSELGTVGYGGKLFLVGAAANSDGSYTFANKKFFYNDETIALWGSGEGSILTLAESNFDPATLEIAPMTGEELQAALDAASGQYQLEKAVEISNDVVIPANLFLTVYSPASITVKNGGSLTISKLGTLGVANGGTLTVEQGGSLINNGSFAVGGGTVCTIDGTLENNSRIDVDYGTVNVNGTYTVGEGGYFQKDTVSTVTGIDTALIGLYSYVYDEATLIESLVPAEGYASTIVYLMCADNDWDNAGDEPFDFTQNITVPAGVQLQLAYFVQDNIFNLNEGVTLTVEGELTIMSYATLNISEGASLVNNNYTCNFGTIVNNGTIAQNGTFQQSGTLTGNEPVVSMTGEELLAELEACEGFYELTETVVISEDMTIPEIRVEVKGGAIIVKEGVTMTNSGGIVIRDGGAVTVNGTLTNTGWYLDVEDGGSLTINGTLTGNDMQIYGGSLTANGTLDINQVNVGVLTLDNITLVGVPQEKINYSAAPTTTDELIAALALVEQYHPWIGLQEDLTLDKNVTIPAGANVAFENSTLTVASGVTLTLDGEFTVHPNSHLVVAEGGKLVNNVQLGITNHSSHENGAVVTVNGELLSNGQIWVTDGGTLNVNGSAEIYNAVHAGFGGNGLMCAVNVSGTLTTYGYLNIVEATSELNINQGGTVTVGGNLYDDQGKPYTNGFLQAGGNVNVSGTLNLDGGFTLGCENGISELNVYEGGVVNVPQNNMWCDITATGLFSNEGTVNNNGIINVYDGTISNYASFVNNGQIRLFGTGTYDDYNDAVISGNEPVDGASAQLQDFLNDLEDGQGANLYNTVTLTEDLIIGLGEDQVVLHGGAELIVPEGVTLTINSPVIVNDGAIVVEEGAVLNINTNVPLNGGEAQMGHLVVNGELNINDGGCLWVDNGALLEVNGTANVLDDPATQDVGAAVHVGFFTENDTRSYVNVNGVLNTGGYVNVTPKGWFNLQEGGTLNIMNDAEYGCGYLDVTGMAQLYGTVNQDGLMSVSNGNGTDEFVPATARIEVYGTLNASDTSTIFINPNASISVAPSGVLTTAGEVKVEQFGTLWVDGDVTFSGPAPVTSYGNIHVNHFLDDSDYNGCLIIDGTMTNYGYMNIGQGGTLFVNGTLNISQTMVEEQGFAGYLNSFGYVIVNGTVNNSSLMDTDSSDGFGSLQINEGGTVNVKDNIVMCVCDGGELIVDGTLNVFTGAYMEVYNAVSGSGSWINNGTVHFGVYTDEETGNESVGYSYFDGWYTQDAGGDLEVELYEGEPIYIDLIPVEEQALICYGGDMESVRTVLGNEEYQTRVTITEDMTIDEDLVIGVNGQMIIQAGVTIPEDVTVTAYGPIIVEELDYDEATASLTVDGTLKLYHPSGTLTILPNSSATVDGYVLNGTSAGVHGALVINGTWEGYAPSVAEGGSITGEGAPSDYEMFQTLTREAAAGGYPAVLSFDLTIPQYTDLYCDLIVEDGVTLTLDGNLAVWGSLTVETGAKLVNNVGLSREYTGAVTIAEGSYSGRGPVINSCMTADDYAVIHGIPMNQQMLLVMMCTTEAAIRGALPLADGYESATLLVRHDITLEENLTIPDAVTLRLYSEWTEDGELIPANFTVPEDVTVTNNGTFHVSEHGTLTIDGRWVGNYPVVDEGGTIVGDYTRLTIGIQYKVQPSFLENAGTAEQAPGLWAGAKTSFYPTLFRIIDGEMMDASAVNVSFSEGAEEYAKIVQKDGLITITANSNLTSHQIFTITLTAENAEPCVINMHLRPKASAANVLLNGETVTGKTILADLNRGDTGFRLTTSGTPADAVPENGTLVNGGELVTWKSSAPAVATVDENGYVTFTGEKTGKVKITMTANYGAKKAAVVTFNVVALPQEIFSAETNAMVLVGGSSASYTAIDDAGNVLKSNAVKWYLCDAQGEAISAHPYAAITEAGKLTTKTVADETKVYLMAQVIGDERSAVLQDPVCVTVYPAIDNVQILAGDIDITGQTLPYDVGATGLTTQLNWAVGPYTESVQSISWKSSKTAVADINADGLITVASEDASGAVKFTLTVTARNGKKSTAVVTLNFGIFTTGLDMAVTLPDGTRTQELNGLSVYGGETLTFEASCLPETVTTKGVTWSLDSKTYGSISSKGVLKTKAVANPTVITVIVQSKDGFGYAIPVKLMPKQVSTGDGMKEALYISTDGQEEEFKYLTKTTHSIKPGSNMQLYANAEVTWKSSNTTVATVDAGGSLEALVNGTATITATAADGRTASFTLKVMKMSEFVDITTKQGDPFVVASGKSLDLVGIVTYSDGSTDKKVTWSVDDTSIATISSSGKLAAAKGLTKAATVRVYADAKDGSSWNFVDVQVVPLTTAIEIFGPFGEDITNTTITWDMLNGTSFTLDAVTYPADAMDAVDWKPSSTKIATIDEHGNVECLSSGTITVTATARDGSGKKATFKLTVKKTMEYLQLPESAIVGGGKSLTFSKLEGYNVDPLATNQTLNWTMTYPDGSAVPTTVATLTKGVLKTKAVTAPVDLYIRAEATDGSGLADDCTVTIYPITKGIALYGFDENDDLVAVTGKTVSAPINRGYVILTDTVNVAGFGHSDDGTADEYLPEGSAWDITYSKEGIVTAAFDGQAINFYATETAKVGDSVKITLKAKDGSAKTAYFIISFTEATPE